MNNIKPIKLEVTQSNMNLHPQSLGDTASRFMKMNQGGIFRRLVDKKIRTEIIDKQQDRQTMEIIAKKGLFEESECHIQKQTVKSYPKMKGSNLNRKYTDHNDDDITAFEYQNNQSHKVKSLNIPTQITSINKKQKPKARAQMINQEVYWNKKRHQPIMILRPTILNPVITIQLSKDQASLLNSSEIKNNYSYETNKKKDFQTIIKDFAKRTKHIYNSYDAIRSKSTKQKTKQVITLTKRLAKLRSKSSSIIEQQSKKNQIYTQIEKLTEKCEFDLQIKCLNSQKQEIFNKKLEIQKHNEDLKEKIRNLIVKQNKASDKKDMKVLVFENIQTNEDDPTQKDDIDRKKKLEIIHDRSKSCIVSAFKGPENKKLKITNILSKIARYKTEQLENKRRIFRQKQSQVSAKNLQMIKFSIKLNENLEKEKNDHILKINQEYSESQAKNSLIKSIKSFCKDKSLNKLPFMSNNLKKSSSLHPDHQSQPIQTNK